MAKTLILQSQIYAILYNGPPMTMFISIKVVIIPRLRDPGN